MTLSLALILGFLFHLIGDYVTQNHWMAVNKTKMNFPALLHAFVYTVPFCFLPVNPPATIIIQTSHFFIDRFRLAEYWIRLVNWEWKSSNHGYPEKTPPWLSTWLLIIVDNVIHIVINSLTIIYFYKP